MALVSVTINGRTYTVDCENGQEEHVRQMAADVQKRVTIMQQTGFEGESLPVVMASLLMADELCERSKQAHEEVAQTEIADEEEREIQEFSQKIHQLALTAENLADSIENTNMMEGEAS